MRPAFLLVFFRVEKFSTLSHDERRQQQATTTPQKSRAQTYMVLHWGCFTQARFEI
jgi:hypothetical protein